MTATLRKLPTFTEPVGGVVSTLEDLLARAKTGEVRAVVACYELVGDATAHAFAWGDRALPMALVGEMNLAAFSMHVSTGRVKPPQ